MEKLDHGSTKDIYYFPIEKYKHQMKDLQEEINKHPGEMSNYISLIKLAILVEDFNKAEHFANKALKINADNQDMINLLGVSQYRQHKGDKAIETFQTLISLVPENIKARINMGLTLMVVKNDPRQAIEQFKAALKIENNNQTALVALGQAYLKNNEIDKALEVFTEAFNYDDKDIKAINGMADAYFAKKDFDSSIDYYERALVVDSRCAFSLYGLYHCYESTGKANKQKEIIDRARAIDTF